jgi:spore germination protein KC
VIPAIAMKDSLEQQENLGKAPQVMFHEFLEAYEDPYIDAFLPIIQKNKETGDFQIYGTAIFKGNKVVGELSSYETKAMLRVLNQIKGGIEVITLDSISEDENNSKITVEIKSSKSNLEARFENGIPIIEINIKETGTISGLSKPIDLTNKKIMEIKKEYEKVIKSETSKVVEKLTKDFNSDIFAFSHTINRANKEYWKKHQNQWDELLPTLEVKVNVTVEIEHYGLIRKIDEN